MKKGRKKRKKEKADNSLMKKENNNTGRIFSFYDFPISKQRYVLPTSKFHVSPFLKKV